MTPAPLPQPAPFTCSNCGASLAEATEFCPRCGARSNEAPRAARSVVAQFFLTIGLLAFGAMGACGGLFVIRAFGPQDFELPAREMLVISVPSLVVGALGFWVCWREARRSSK